ncbi:MAG: DUF3306 domain-containing protein [Rhodocyclaceae bacterium]|nr:DUF3306 domain-containing protein [Rhodocyclaceae bacterium]
MSETPCPPQTVIGRWSRLKRGETPAEPQPTPLESPTTAEAQPAPLTDQDMPAVDGLDEGSDFSCFLSAGVSDGLRRQALDRLFRLPMCGVLDGLNDYDDDYSRLEALGDTVTYQMKQWAQRQLQDELARRPEPDEAPSPGADDADGADLQGEA